MNRDYFINHINDGMVRDALMKENIVGTEA